MNEQTLQLVSIKDFLRLTAKLISKDLKLQKHLYCMELAGFEVSFDLQLQDEIFKLIGFRKGEVENEAKEWYFEQVEKSFSIDVLQDEKKLTEISADILSGLDRFRMRDFNEMY